MHYDRTFAGGSLLRFGTLLITAMALTGLAWGQTTGFLTGRVANQATGVHLEGASVQIEETGQRVFTGRDGSFRLQVPPGTYTLVASYTGLDREQATVTVSAGETVSRNFALTAEIYQMGELVVAGEREGSALAITLQRQAPNVKNIVSADAFGSLAGNPADLLERVTGITVDRVGGDIRTISVRGIAADLNSVQIDGNRIASVSNARHFQFQNVGSDHIESMEVIKAPTPDMDADSIGGAVNLRSRSAFDLTGRRLTYSLGGIHQWASRDDVHPTFTLSYSDVYDVFGGDSNLGISMSLGFRQHTALIDRTWQDWQNTGDSPAFRWRLRVQDFANTRTRYGGGMKIDYRLNANNMVFANFTAAPHRENNQAKQFTASTPATGVAIAPGFTDLVTEVLPTHNNSLLQLLGNAHNRKAEAYTGQLGGRSSGDAWEADYDVAYSWAQNNPYALNSSITMRQVGFITDGSDLSRWSPRITFTAGPDPMDLDNFGENLLTEAAGRTENQIYGTQLNFRRDFTEMAVPAYIKAGVRLRWETLDRWRFDRRWSYLGPDGDSRLGQFEDVPYTERGHSPFGGLYPQFRYMAPKLFASHKDAHGDEWSEDVAFSVQQDLTGRQEIRENVNAAYFLGNTQINRFSALAGLRVEQTRVRGEGPLREVTPEEAARRAAWEGPVTEEERFRRIAEEFRGRRSDRRDYRNVFPGVHLKYEPLDGLITRASWSTGIGRPNFSTIIPNDSVNWENQIVTANNTGLRPQYSDNFDASIEYYFEPVGLFSAGVFLKEIRDFIFATEGNIIPEGPDNGFDGLYAGFELRTQANGGHARVRGFELNYQQQFTFLPGWMSGLGFFANYTHLETRGDYGNIGTVQTTGTLPGFTPRAANAGISYIRGRVNARVHYGHNDDTLLAWNVNEHLRRWKLASERIDVKLKYLMTRNMEIYLDLYNVFGDNQREVFSLVDRPFQILYRNDPQVHFGISGRF